MNMQWNETQEMLRASAREFLSENYPKKRIRDARASEQGMPEGLWTQLGQLGWLGLALPEAAGGSEMGFLDLCLLSEEMGYACIPSPFTESIAGCGLVLAETGAEPDLDSLRMLGLGESVIIPAFAGAYDNEGFLEFPRASREGDDFRIDGTHLFVPHGAIASSLLCLAQEDSSSNPALFLIPANAAGISLTALHSARDERPCRIDFTGVHAPASTLVSRGERAGILVRRARQRMDVARCFDIAGALTWVLEDTVAYARDRRQFGQPIGSFQVLQHYCADMHIMLEGLRISAYHAAWRMTEGLEADSAVATTCAFAHQVVPRFLGMAHQIHGAMGVTIEHDLYLYSTHVSAPGAVLAPLSEYLEASRGFVTAGATTSDGP